MYRRQKTIREGFIFVENIVASEKVKLGTSRSCHKSVQFHFNSKIFLNSLVRHRSALSVVEGFCRPSYEL